MNNRDTKQGNLFSMCL